MNPVARRLRDRNTPYGWASLAETAAVEIDRLELELEQARADTKIFARRYATASKEVTRLRDEIESINGLGW